jgi:hypothetical protein
MIRVVFVATGIGLAYTKAFGLSDEDKEAMLREKYPDIIKQTSANRKPMADFFANMKKDIDSSKNNGGNEISATESDNQRKFEELLRGGKTKVNKRQGPNVGLEHTIQPVAKPDVIKIKGRKERNREKKKAASENEAEGGAKNGSGSSWFW